MTNGQDDELHHAEVRGQDLDEHVHAGGREVHASQSAALGQDLVDERHVDEVGRHQERERAHHHRPPAGRRSTIGF
jgi:hypothetical protein